MSRFHLRRGRRPPAPSRPRRRWRWVWYGVALLVTFAVAAGAAAYLGVLPRSDEAGPSAPHETSLTSPQAPPLRLATPPPAPGVLTPITADPPVRLAPLRRQLSPLLHDPAFGRSVGFSVEALGDSTRAWSTGPRSVTPASTLKLLTTTAALAALGPSHRFTTSVVQGAGRRSIVLVGGGDPLLVADRKAVRRLPHPYPRPATLQQLARQTATRLLADGVRRVSLGYDASLFTGPAVNPRWPATYVPENVVSPISSLWVNEGREQPGLAERSADPARAAVKTFAALLAEAGVTVTGPATPRPTSPPAGAAPLATVQSAPLALIVQHILEDSDNEGCEVLLRQVALATGRAGSSSAGVQAVRATLTGLGLDVRGATWYDGSGLSRQDRVPVSLLLAVLQLAASPGHPELRAVLAGLPVAGFSGSLSYRFDDGATASGRGYVRAKTGTLTGVSGLAGLVTTTGGSVLVFAAVADRVPVAQTLDARADLDQIAATLASCAC